MNDHPINSIGPYRILKDAINAVPAVKYTLGVLGIVSAIAIIKMFGIDLKVAVIGTIIMLILMTALLVFAKLSRTGPKDFRYAALILMYSFLAILIATATFLVSSVFFQWPVDLRYWLVGSAAVGKEANTSYLRGKVVDQRGEPIDEAAIELEELPNQSFTTTSDGGFYIDKIPKKHGERARIYVRKIGYQNENEFVTLPGPIRIVLEK